MLQLEREILVSHGLSAKIAHNAGDAIEILKRDSVDAVVADMKIPGEISTPISIAGSEHRAGLAHHVAFTASEPGRFGANICAPPDATCLPSLFRSRNSGRSVQADLRIPAPQLRAFVTTRSSCHGAFSCSSAPCSTSRPQCLWISDVAVT